MPILVRPSSIAEKALTKPRQRGGSAPFFTTIIQRDAARGGKDNERTAERKYAGSQLDVVLRVRIGLTPLERERSSWKSALSFFSSFLFFLFRFSYSSRPVLRFKYFGADASTTVRFPLCRTRTPTSMLSHSRFAFHSRSNWCVAFHRIFAFVPPLSLSLSASLLFVRRFVDSFRDYESRVEPPFRIHAIR